MYSLLEPGACRQVEARGVRWRISPVAVSSTLLRDAVLFAAGELGAYAVALHPQGSLCSSEECHRFVGEHPLVEADPRLGVDSPLTLDGGEIDALVASEWLRGFEFVRSELDSCPERAWLILPELDSNTLSAVCSRCVAPPGAGPSRRGDDPARYLDALDELARTQLSVLSTQPTALLGAAALQAHFSNPGDRLPFEVGRWHLGHGTTLELPPPVLPLRAQARTARWSAQGRSEVVSVRAGFVEGVSGSREWVVRCDLEAPCGHLVTAALPALDAGCFETRWHHLGVGHSEVVAYGWEPRAGEQVQAALTLWAPRLGRVTRAGGGWEELEGALGVVGRVVDLDLCATPVCGTRWWRLDLAVPVRCRDPRCAHSRPVEVYLSVLGPWAGAALRRGDVVRAEGLLTASITPAGA